MATPGNDLGTLQLNTIIESTATAGQYGVVVLDSTGADISSGGGGGGAVTIANGADVVEGNTADVKVVGDNAGTVSAKLRGLNTTLSSVDGKITTCNTGAVTISAALPAGANAIGTVTAVQSTASNLNGQMVGNVASAASDSGNPVKVGGVYNSSAPTFTNGQRADLQVNSNGSLNTTLSTLLSGEDQTNSLFACATKPISGSTYTATINTDFGTVVTLKVKNAAGNLFSLNGHNNNAATRYLQIHNTTTALTGGEVPFIPSFVVPTGSQIILGPTDLAGMPGGLYCSTGITWGWSTTKNTYTAATAGDHMTGCSYV